MYGGFGNSLLSGCLMKFPMMIPVIAISGGIFYSTVCDGPPAAPSAPMDEPVIVKAVLVPTPPVVVAPPQVVTPVVEDPKPVLKPLPKKKIPG